MGKHIHILSNIDLEKVDALCSNCGIVSIIKCGRYWRCSIAKKQELDLYYVNNKDRILTSAKKRKQTPASKEINRSWQRKMKSGNINFRLASGLRVRLYQAIKSEWKTGSAVNDLGCSIIAFKEYIENKFEPGMTWNNWGTWHLDHIVPLSSFDLTDREQFLKAVSYTNMQPLWKCHNLSKGNRIS